MESLASNAFLENERVRKSLRELWCDEKAFSTDLSPKGFGVSFCWTWKASKNSKNCRLDFGWFLNVCLVWRALRMPEPKADPFSSEVLQRSWNLNQRGRVGGSEASHTVTALSRSVQLVGKAWYWSGKVQWSWRRCKSCKREFKEVGIIVLCTNLFRNELLPFSRPHEPAPWFSNTCCMLVIHSISDFFGYSFAPLTVYATNWTICVWFDSSFEFC